MPFGEDCPKTAKLLVFRWTNPEFPRTNTKIPTVALEAFPMFAFARGTRDRGRCFPTFPRRDETPCPRSASLSRHFPALCWPEEEQPRPRDVPVASLAASQPRQVPPGAAPQAGNCGVNAGC